jgi:hypothetical protein
LFPETNLAELRNVASGGKASTVVGSVAVRLEAEDVTPGSCTAGESSDPVMLSLFLQDDDGEVILNRAKLGLVCSFGQKTTVKFTAWFEGPKNCKDSAAPGGQPTQGDIFALATTDDGSLLVTRKIMCRSDTITPAIFNLTPPAHYHVTMGDTLNFTVTATQDGSPIGVTASGLPPGATFVGGNFSWVGAFSGSTDNGRHEVTFMAGGDHTDVVVGVTEFAITSFELVDPLTAEPWPGNIIPIPVDGQQNVWALAKCNGSPVCGQGANGWPEFIWSIGDPSIADFFDLGVTAGIDGLTVGMTPVEARFTDATVGVWTATATLDVQ